MQKKASVEVLFGKVLKQLREEKGLTQEKLAELAEVDRTYIYRLETGKRSPSLGIIFRLADGLGVTASSLLDKVGKLK